MGNMKAFNQSIDPATCAPVTCTLLLVLWTASVYRFSKYGDDWAIWPAILALPICILAHLCLIVLRKPRLTYCIYAIVHALIFLPVWFVSLMLISKDSL